MITKEIVVSKFEIDTESNIASIRTDTIIKENGVEISRSFHRCTYVPGDIDIAAKCLGIDSPEIAYLNLIWTPEAIEYFRLANNAIT